MVDKLIVRLEDLKGTGKKINLVDAFTSLTGDIIGQVTSGELSQRKNMQFVVDKKSVRLRRTPWVPGRSRLLTRLAPNVQRRSHQQPHAETFLLAGPHHEIHSKMARPTHEPTNVQTPRISNRMSFPSTSTSTFSLPQIHKKKPKKENTFH